MNRLLFNERPIVVLPSLAVKLGIVEAMVLQQLHYWLSTSAHTRDGRKWVFNTYSEWQQQLPFMSESKVKRTIKKMEDQGYVVAANYNRSKMDQTKWYSLDYQKLEELEAEECGEETAIGDAVEPDMADSRQEEWNLGSGDALEDTERTKGTGIPYAAIIAYLNEKTHSTYKAGTKKTRSFIEARWNEGFQLNDFKKVIDLKSAEWLDDPKWSAYLRPGTLFGTKFESYLNQKAGKKRLSEEDFDLNDEA